MVIEMSLTKSHFQKQGQARENSPGLVQYFGVTTLRFEVGRGGEEAVTKTQNQWLYLSGGACLGREEREGKLV